MIKVNKFIISIILLFFLNGIQIKGTTPFEGSWEGKLSITPEVGLRLRLNVTDQGKEEPVITMDSPDQGAFGIPVEINLIKNDSLDIKVTSLMVNYKGILKNDSIIGDFSQGPLRLPLILTQVKNSLNRPQTPQAPFPYETEEVSFTSANDAIILNGTISATSLDDKNLPIILLISGSGVQNRDEEIFEHKPFAVIADYLARNGIATLRYDDRSFEFSSGETPASTTYENALDAKGAINFLKNKGYKNIGILGHSEGALIADILAAEDNDINCIIEVGGPVVSGDSILLSQNELALKDGGLPEEYILIYMEALKGMFLSHKDNNTFEFKESDYEIFNDEYSRNPVTIPLAKNIREINQNISPWIKFFIKYNPIEDIKKIKVPIMFIYGEKDTQVPADMNIRVLTKEFPEGKIKLYPELNHLMQHSITGKVKEYAEIEETFAPEVLEDIKIFIKEVMTENEK